MKCKKLYVGETKRKLKERLNNDRSDVNLNKNTAVGIHFNNPSHSVSHLKISPIQLIPEDQDIYHLNIEKHWINK